jgi:hypothetical protein
LDVNYFVLTHDTAEGLLAIKGRGRPSNEEIRMRLEFPGYMVQEIEKLRSELSIDDGASVLLVTTSLSSNEMVQLVAMHPEVWFIDVTAGVNRQKQDMLVLAIRTPSGVTFPANVTFIPSGRRWVFECVYRYAFVALFGKVTISRNWLALFDEDNAEYGPFQHCIQTVPEYAKSRVMLCAFHAVWMPFKKNIYPLITKRFSDSNGCLTKIGKSVGE